MIRVLAPVLVIALLWTLFALKRRETRATVAIIGSVPLGALLGFYIGCSICYGVLRWQGRGGSHNDMLPVVSAGMAGMLAGAIALPALAWFLFKPKK